ncbi:dihydrolipoamide acetyltransferase family protein [Pararhodobacter oceanensis]|uniref:Dihydrolipoamide acetyltransferase component of pyruvate dehydrogenase complex n=1 Tax=Pararhodobacter oceanensis TaxID=2172121 RepID=A0A2T8HXU5_9RHOB|nr:dihydrolipoamide acetyltransferase family protein [Pararhodobacter oceanensis]PVH30248.1 branched-chain alpha-keto acid dehydrogenase subunit E2 [Pararhodobacter oceanensis]
MGQHTIKVPDVGEGIAEVELAEWHVAVGDLVREDQVLAAVMTDKATVEIPSPSDGKVLWLGAEEGDKMAVGAALIRLEVAGGGNTEAAAELAPEPVSESGPVTKPEARAETPQAEEVPKPARATPREDAAPPKTGAFLPRPEGEKPMAAPSVRARAREAGVDLRRVAGSGPAGRITHEDLDRLEVAPDTLAPAAGYQRNTAQEEIKVIGLRRKIAERMAEAHARIAPITYVEEVDMSALEELRERLNKTRREEQPKLTLLPFLMRAMVRAIAEQPRLNAHYDDEAGVILQSGGVHIGIAAQTGAGLMVPVVRHAEARDLWGCAAELNRVSAAAKAGHAAREELSGSTITITSLGALGGIVSTPIINRPEVAIIGVNKMAVRPVWDGSAFVPRKMMNLSSSFDHRVVDGWDAAVFVQKIKSLLETPALIFIEG